MKKLLSLLLWLSPFLINAQDVITLKNGNEINVKVTEVTSEEVKYKKSDSSPIYSLKKNEVFMIKYKDGTKDVFTGETKSITTKETDGYTNEDLLMMGKRDAQRYYQGRKSGTGGTIITTFLTGGILGLIPAIACSFTPPRDANLMIPKSSYSDNPVYYESYKSEAIKIKRRKVWSGYGIGFGAAVAFILVVSAASE